MVGTTLYYLHQNALGSTRLVSTATVTTQFSTNYKPYGPLYGSTGSETFKFTGKPLDSATAPYYFGVRFYDSSDKKFVSRHLIKTGVKMGPIP